MKKVSEKTKIALATMIGQVEDLASQAGSEIEVVVRPIRSSILRRYPVIFALLVTIGATATFLGLENTLMSLSLFVQKPWLLLLSGIAILILTGKLYKKLG